MYHSTRFRTFSRRPALRLAALLVATLGLGAKARAQFLYSVTNLGTFGSDISYALDINNSGQVVGTTYNTSTGVNRAFLHNGSSMLDISSPGHNSNIAYAINNSGKIVGESDTRPFLYDGGVITDIGIGFSYSTASDINDSGQIAATGYSGDASLHAFIRQGSSLTDLGKLGDYSDALGINNLGQVVGLNYYSDGTGRAFLYNGSTMLDLGTLGGDSSYASKINDSGQVIGASYINASYEHAFIYNGSTMIDLGTFGGNTSFAYGINDAGQVVGSADTAFSRNAFLYNGSSLIDLNSVTDLAGSNFTSLVEARAINASGQIVGYGTTTTGESRAFLLTPIGLSAVPEPSTYATICTLGLAALAGHRLHRRRLATKAARLVSAST